MALSSLKQYTIITSSSSFLPASTELSIKKLKKCADSVSRKAMRWASALYEVNNLAESGVL
jgi:hypothetical protein